MRAAHHTVLCVCVNNGGLEIQSCKFNSIQAGMHSHTRRPQVKKSNWVPLIIHVSFFGVKYWSHPHYWAWLWFKLKTSEVSFLPVRSSGPSFVLPIVKLCLRVNLTKQSVVYNLSRISRASTKHGKKKERKKKELRPHNQSSPPNTSLVTWFFSDYTPKSFLLAKRPVNWTWTWTWTFEFDRDAVDVRAFIFSYV